MRLLVTGGAGFVGSHVVTRALAEGMRVLVLDDLSTGRLENLAAVAAHPRLDVRIGSILDRALVLELVARADAVVHLAAAVGMRLVLARPAHTVTTNVVGTATVFAACAARRVPVLFASSSEVYGKGTRVPFGEEDDLVLGPTCSPRWAYACSKAQGERLALAHHRAGALRVTIARLFNTAGARQRACYGMVLPTLAAQAVRGEPLTVHGDGTQTRCFAHVRDVAATLLSLLARETPGGEIFNVGGDGETTIDALAALVRAAAGGDPPIVHVPLDVAYAPGFEDVGRRVPDLRKLGRVLGRRPATPLAAIVAEVVEDQRRELRARA